MRKGVLHVGPGWLLGPVMRMNSLIPGGEVHPVRDDTIGDRDVHNLLERFPPHLSLLPEKEKRGEAGLRALGIQVGAPFVCLHVRDDSYMMQSLPWGDWSYHDYRNYNIQKYILAAREMVNCGY